MKFRFDRDGTFVYPALRVTATTGDVIKSDYAIDKWWTEVDASTPATIPPPAQILPPYSETPTGAFLIYSRDASGFIVSAVAAFDEYGYISDESLPARLSEVNLTAFVAEHAPAPDLSGYATLSGGVVPDSELPTRLSMDELVSLIQSQAPAPDLSGYAALSSGVVPDSELPSRLGSTSLDGRYALKSEIGGGGDVTQAELDAVQSQVTGLDANQTALMQDAATREELCVGYSWTGAWDGTLQEFQSASSTQTLTAFIAPFDCRLASVAMVREYSNVVASNTAYVTVTIKKHSPAGYPVIATKTTRVSDGEAWVHRKTWSFDGVPFNSSAALLNKGDQVQIETVTSAGRTLRFPINITLRVVPT